MPLFVKVLDSLLISGETLDDCGDKVVYCGFVIGVDRSGYTVSNNGAHSHGTVSHEFGKASIS